MPMNDEDQRLLPRVLGMLGSDHDGEKLNAVALIAKLLVRNGLTWADLPNLGGFRSGYGGDAADLKRRESAGFVRGYSAGYDAALAEMVSNGGRTWSEPPEREEFRTYPGGMDIWHGYDPNEVAGPGWKVEIDQLRQLWKIEKRLDDWEHGFVQSVAEQLLEKRSLSGKQRETLNDVWLRRVMGVRAGVRTGVRT